MHPCHTPGSPRYFWIMKLIKSQPWIPDTTPDELQPNFAKPQSNFGPNLDQNSASDFIKFRPFLFGYNPFTYLIILCYHWLQPRVNPVLLIHVQIALFTSFTPHCPWLLAMHTALLTSFASPLPLTLSCFLVLVYKPLIHVCIRHLEYRLAYPYTWHLILPISTVNHKDQLPKAKPLASLPLYAPVSEGYPWT